MSTINSLVLFLSGAVGLALDVKYPDALRFGSPMYIAFLLYIILCLGLGVGLLFLRFIGRPGDAEDPRR